MLRSTLTNLSLSTLTAGFLVAGLAGVPTAGAASSSQPKPTDIAAARALPLGTVVTVEGTATVPSGAFSSSSFDEGFAVQDRTGGIYVSIATNVGVRLGQKVRATGQLQDSSGLLVLVPADAAQVEIDHRGRHVRPVWVATGSVGPANQGLLVRVVGHITQPIEPDPPFGTKVFVDDGSGPIRVFLNTSTGIDSSGLAQGQLISVVGFSSAFNDPEIDPRQQSDIRHPESSGH